MRVRVLGCHGSRVPGFFTSAMLINDNVLVDAGAVTTLPMPEQAAIDHVILTHAHLDHIVDLAFLADNVFTLRRSPLRVWGPEPVLDSVRRYLFNNEIWPDFATIRAGDFPLIEFNPLPVGVESEVGGVRLRWEQTNHVVFTAGYLLSQGDGSVFVSGDTTETDALWVLPRDCSDLRLAFVETSFPNRLEDIARVSGHLTPAMLQRELCKIGKPQLPVKVFHMKPQFLDEIVPELQQLSDPRLQVLNGGEVFMV